MPLTVKQYRTLLVRYNDAMATAHSKALNKQKLGYTFKQTFVHVPEIIDSIVAEAIMDANEPLTERNKVRLPEWISQTTFNSLIDKMSIYAGSNV
jgi:hypothetical protein